MRSDVKFIIPKKDTDTGYGTKDKGYEVAITGHTP